MGNGVSTDQGNFPTHGIRDVRQAVDRKQHDWSELARHPSINNQLRCLLATANPYITSVLTCQVICGQIALKGLMLNMPPQGAVLIMVSLPLACIDDLMFFLF